MAVQPDGDEDARRLGTRPDIELDENVGLMRRAWIFERISWTLLALFVLASLLGAFGEGLLSHGRVESDGIRLRYRSVTRVTCETSLRIDVPVPAGAKEVEIALDREWMASIIPSNFSPQPERSISDGTLRRHVFAVTPSPARRELEVVLHFSIKDPGVLHGRVMSGTRHAEFTQVVYP